MTSTPLALEAARGSSLERTVAAGLGLAAGFALLLVRPAVPDGAAGSVLLAGTYVGLAGLSLAPVFDDVETRGALAPMLVFGAGLAAVMGAAWAAGRPVPVPAAAFAPAWGVGAAVAEEAFFRRLVYGRLLRWGPPVAVAGSAVAFGLVHLPVYGFAALPVDLGAGLLFSWQRWASGRWTVPAATHAAANLLAVV